MICEGCEGMTYVASHVYGWAARPRTAELDEAPAEGTVCLERCGTCEVLEYDEDAQPLARRDGVEFGKDWPWIVTSQGIETYNRLRTARSS